MVKFSPLADKFHQYQSAGHFRIANIGPDGKTINPRKSLEKVDIRDLDDLPRNDPSKREVGEILALTDSPRAANLELENPFYEIFKRVERAFEKPPLNQKSELRDQTFRFLQSLEYRVVDRPDGHGQYITGIPTRGTYDKSNVDQSKILEILDVLATKLGVTQIMDNNFGTFNRDGKPMVAAGKLILNFATIDGESVLERVPKHAHEFAKFMDDTNAFGAYYNGDINKNIIFNYREPLHFDDFMKEWGPKLDQVLERFSEEDGSNFIYDKLDKSSVPAIAPDFEPQTLSEALSCIDHSVPGSVLTRIANAIDNKAIEFSKDSQTILIYPDLLDRKQSLDQLTDDLARRIPGDFISMRIVDKVDIRNRQERETN